MGISIFTTGTASTDHNSDNHFSLIKRGYQIAEEIGAKLNPKQDYQDDICIYVKPTLDSNQDMIFKGKSSYLDLIDYWQYIPLLRKHPKTIAIVCSERDYIYLASEGITNKTTIIPQHHCNFDQEKRDRKNILVVGAVGTRRSLRHLPQELEPQLNERGVNLLIHNETDSRQDLVNFYKKIDIQIVWRPWKKNLANPLQIVNAASYGIPSIALEENYFNEMGNCYISINGLGNFFTELDLLINSSSRYAALSSLCLIKAKKYHISNIAKLYKNLT